MCRGNIVSCNICELILGLGWDRLSAGSTIVDVGGGVGSQTLVFLKAFPHLDFVIQDQPKALAAADEVSQRQLLRLCTC